MPLLPTLMYGLMRALNWFIWLLCWMGVSLSLSLVSWGHDQMGPLQQRIGILVCLGRCLLNWCWK